MKELGKVNLKIVKNIIINKIFKIVNVIKNGLENLRALPSIIV